MTPHRQVAGETVHFPWGVKNVGDEKAFATKRWKLSETLNMGWVLFVQSRNLQRKEMGHFSALDIIAFSTCSAAQAFFFTQELYQQSGQIIIAFYQPKE